jgi:hypothetical protein
MLLSFNVALGGCGKSSADEEPGAGGTDAGRGGSDTGGGGTSGTAGEGGDAGTSGHRGIEHGYTPTAACTTRSVCGEGIECVELVAGGVTRCVFMGGRPTTTCSGDERNECCESSECGVCRALDLGCCAGSPGVTDRVLAAACVYPGDGCTADPDCPSGSFCTIVAGRAACRNECTPNALTP